MSAVKTEVRLSEVSLLTPLSRGPLFEIQKQHSVFGVSERDSMSSHVHSPLTGHAQWVVRNVRKFCCSLWDRIFGISDVSLTLLLVTKMCSQSANKV